MSLCGLLTAPGCTEDVAVEEPAMGEPGVGEADDDGDDSVGEDPDDGGPTEPEPEPEPEPGCLDVCCTDRDCEESGDVCEDRNCVSSDLLPECEQPRLRVDTVIPLAESDGPRFIMPIDVDGVAPLELLVGSGSTARIHADVLGAAPRVTALDLDDTFDDMQTAAIDVDADGRHEVVATHMRDGAVHLAVLGRTEEVDGTTHWDVMQEFESQRYRSLIAHDIEGDDAQELIAVGGLNTYDVFDTSAGMLSSPRGVIQDLSPAFPARVFGGQRDDLVSLSSVRAMHVLANSEFSNSSRMLRTGLVQLGIAADLDGSGLDDIISFDEAQHHNTVVRLWTAHDIGAYEAWHTPVPESQRVWLEDRNVQGATKARLRFDAGLDIILREPEQLSILYTDDGRLSCVETLLQDTPGDLVAAVDLDGDGDEELIYDDDDQLWILQTSIAEK